MKTITGNIQNLKTSGNNRFTEKKNCHKFTTTILKCLYMYKGFGIIKGFKRKHFSQFIKF